MGLMITASHNPEKDNGVKIVDRDGGMLVQEWEGVAASFANAEVGSFARELRKFSEFGELAGEEKGKGMWLEREKKRRKEKKRREKKRKKEKKRREKRN